MWLWAEWPQRLFLDWRLQVSVGSTRPLAALQAWLQAEWVRGAGFSPLHPTGAPSREKQHGRRASGYPGIRVFRLCSPETDLDQGFNCKQQIQELIPGSSSVWMRMWRRALRGHCPWDPGHLSLPSPATDAMSQASSSCWLLASEIEPDSPFTAETSSVK